MQVPLETGSIARTLLTSALGVSGRRHAPAALNPRERTPRYPFDRTGLRDGLDTEAKGKNNLPLAGIKPRSSSL
jgi:hypothetical protein